MAGFLFKPLALDRIYVDAAATVQHADEIGVLVLIVVEAGVAYARRCSWRSDRDRNGAASS
jgi:hypothetical protein